MKESPQNAIVVKKSSLFDNSTLVSDWSWKEPNPNVMSIIMLDLDICDEAMVEMEIKINFMIKAVEERDHEIACSKKSDKKLINLVKRLLGKLMKKKNISCTRIDHNNPPQTPHYC